MEHPENTNNEDIVNISNRRKTVNIENMELDIDRAIRKALNWKMYFKFFVETIYSCS